MTLSLRRRSREVALQILFQREFDPRSSIEDALKMFSDNFELDKGTREFAEFIVNGVVHNLVQIDQKIQSFSKNWKLSRMPVVDRNILRIAAYELMFNKEVPPQVAIDEAIEVGKRYGSQDSSAFINGILDNILKSQEL